MRRGDGRLRVVCICFFAFGVALVNAWASHCANHKAKPAKDWVQIEVRKAFAFRIPPDLKMKPVKGKDSHVARYESDSMQLSYDYGWYSDRLTRYSKREDVKTTETTIDGKKARIVTMHSKTKGSPLEYVAAAHFSGLRDPKMRLTFFVRCASSKEQQLAQVIFDSVRFK